MLPYFPSNNKSSRTIFAYQSGQPLAEVEHTYKYFLKLLESNLT